MLGSDSHVTVTLRRLFVLFFVMDVICDTDTLEACWERRNKKQKGSILTLGGNTHVTVNASSSIMCSCRAMKVNGNSLIRLWLAGSGGRSRDSQTIAGFISTSGRGNYVTVPLRCHLFCVIKVICDLLIRLWLVA